MLQHLAWNLLFPQSSCHHHWAPRVPRHHPPVNPNYKQGIPRPFPKCCCETVTSHRDLSLTQPGFWIGLPPEGLQSWEFTRVMMLSSIGSSMFYRLSEFTFTTMFFHFMNYLSITKLDDFMNLNCIIDLNFVYDRISSMNELGTQVEFMPDPEWSCLGFHCPRILQAAFTHCCAF